MKKSKYIFIVLATIITAVLVLVVMWQIAWKHYYEMTELGYQEIVPRAKITKTETLSSGQETARYYVAVPVETQLGVRDACIPFSAAYGKSDIVYGIEKFRAETPIKGYYYYSPTLGEVYYSKDIATAKEYMYAKSKGWVIAVLAVVVMVLLGTGLCWYFGKVVLPDIPGGMWHEEQLLVCRYSSGGFAFGMMMSLSMVIMMGILVGVMVTDGQYALAVVFAWLGALFLILVVTFGLWMKNYVVVFYPEGIVYRNALGKVECYSDSDIQYVSVIDAYRNHSVRIQTTKRNIWLNAYSTRYWDAVQWVNKYPAPPWE